MVDLGVDHIGSVILSVEPWRNPELKRTVAVVQAAGRKSSLIPLFHEPDIIAEAIQYYRPDIIHFCEDIVTEPQTSAALERQWIIRRRFPDIEIMRSIPIARQGAGAKVPSLDLAARFESASDWFLTDTLLLMRDHATESEQPVNGFVGITGLTCDWSVARALVCTSRIPVILAGGIGPDNVARGILQVRPAGVDSCTLTNQADAGRAIRFCKDPAKVGALILAAGQASAELTMAARRQNISSTTRPNDH